MLGLGPGHNETIQRACDLRVKMGPGKIMSNDGQSKKNQKKDVVTLHLYFHK